MARKKELPLRGIVFPDNSFPGAFAKHFSGEKMPRSVAPELSSHQLQHQHDHFRVAFQYIYYTTSNSF